MINFSVCLIRVIWGLFLFAVRKVFIINIQIGYASWEMLAVGLAKTTGLNIGSTIIVISIFIVILIFLLGENWSLNFSKHAVNWFISGLNYDYQYGSKNK